MNEIEQVCEGLEGFASYRVSGTAGLAPTAKTGFKVPEVALQVCVLSSVEPNPKTDISPRCLFPEKPLKTPTKPEAAINRPKPLTRNRKRTLKDPKQP